MILHNMMCQSGRCLVAVRKVAVIVSIDVCIVVVMFKAKGMVEHKGAKAL